MMDWTDRHCRAFHRVLTRRALLYTEMVTADAVVFGARDHLLGFSAEEHPVVLQLGGSDPERLGQAARIGADYGYDEINLNVGCPSDRVQSGRFGACLMREPGLVAELVDAMRGAGPPASVKCRIGVDDQEPREALFEFVATVARSGCTTFIVHARKAWLSGLSPKENREIPPLDYAIVRDLKAAHPELEIILNGGLASATHAKSESHGVDGVMLGRAAYKTPAELMYVDSLFYGAPADDAGRLGAVERHLPYIARNLADGVALHTMTRHMLGLFHGQPGGRAWRRVLTEEGVRAGAGLDVIARAVEVVRTEATRAGERLRASA